MPERMEVYKCRICGNIVEILHKGRGSLVCCGQAMQRKKVKSDDEGKEKHVPVVEGTTVKVGSVPHPMEDKHWIEWIEIIAGGKAYRQFLNPGEAPEATFNVQGESITAREYCNLHGLWKG